MKILITSDCYLPTINGVVTSIVNLKVGLEQRGHKVKILTLSPSVKSYVDGDVIYVGSFSAGSIYPGVRVRCKSTRKYIKDILDWKPDIVHAQSEFNTFSFASKIANKLSIPLIHTYHTLYEDYTHYISPSKKMGKAAAVKLTRKVADKVDCMIAPTEKIEHLLERYEISSPTRIIPTGIDLPKFQISMNDEDIEALRDSLQIPSDHKMLVSVSRVCKEKNIDELLSFFAKCKDIKAIFVIVGDGPHKQALEELTDKLGMREMVRFTGMVSPSEVAKYYITADLFLSASNSETQGLTYIEALAAGTPILCKKDDCLKEIISQSENGYTYQTEQEFCTVLTAYLADNERANSMSKNAILIAEGYSVESFVKKIEDVYTDYTMKRNSENSELHSVENADKFLMTALSSISLIFCIVLGLYGYTKGYFSSIKSLQELVASAGILGPVLFILAQIIQVVVPIIPGGLGCLAGVILFGPLWGFVYNYIGICLGSLLVFAISKSYGAILIPKFFSRKQIDKYTKWTDGKNRFRNFFVAAIFLPVAPDDFLCYLAGTTQMTWTTYTAIILLGKPLSIAAYSLGLSVLFQQMFNFGGAI